MAQTGSGDGVGRKNEFAGVEDNKVAFFLAMELVDPALTSLIAVGGVRLFILGTHIK